MERVSFFLITVFLSLLMFAVSQEHPSAFNTLCGRSVDKASGDTMGSTVSIETSTKTWS